jgi:Leucine-rich repeat (LRR) protein
MIGQVVLVIVISAQVNSQELCPKVCQCKGKEAKCTDLFREVTNMTKYKFHSGLRDLRVTGRTNLEMEEDIFLRWNITSLTVLELIQNNITKIWQRAFCSLADLRHLNLYLNNVTKVDYKTLFNNTRLEWLSLAANRITELHQSTFQQNVRLYHIDLHGNKLTSLHQDLFRNNLELKSVDLHDNMIGSLHPSTFRNNSKLSSLDLAINQITVIHPDTFIHNQELTFLYIHHNNVTEIGNSSLPGLDQMKELDLSHNNIEQLNPLVFRNKLNSANRQNHQAWKLKRFNVARNKIRSFNLELYFPISCNCYSPNPTFQLEYLNVSSNRLTTLDVASMQWLNYSSALIDFSANTWNCDCSVLLEVMRGLKHRLTLQCASPRQLQGMSWDVMEVFCPRVAEDKHNNSGGFSVLTTALIVAGVLVVCGIGWILVLVKVAKSRSSRPQTPEYCDVYPRRSTNIPLHLYEAVRAGPSDVKDQTYENVGKIPSYLSVHF